MKKTKLLITLLALLAFGPMAWAQWTGSGTEANPYQISSTSNWNTLASNVNGGTTYSGIYFKLMADITITETVSSGTPTTMVGTSDSKSFQGIFDGNGHTITLNYNDTRDADYCAPFRYINGATIKNLHVTGSIYKTKSKNAGGLVGKAVGNNTISNCRSSVDINFNKDGDVSSGGFIGELRENGNTTFTNCLFDGKLRGTNAYRWGGFVGWVTDGKSATFNNCLFNPEQINFDINDSDDDSKTFARKGGTVTTSNCYYTTLIKDAQGATNASSYNNTQLLNALGICWETITENNVEKVVPIMGNPFEGEGTEASPYLIADANDWNLLAAFVNIAVSTYDGKFLKMTDDFTVMETVSSSDPTKMIGISEERSFKGTFDGNGNTMTLNINDTRNGDDDHYCGPFRFINGATIKNLHVAGTLIKSHKKHAGGIVGKAYGTNNIIDCRVSATISTTSDGDGSHGGFLGDLRGGTTHFKSCLFDGQLIGTNTESWLKKRPVSAASQLTAMEPSQAQHFTTVASSIVTYSTPLKTKP